MANFDFKGVPGIFKYPTRDEQEAIFELMIWYYYMIKECLENYDLLPQ